MSTETSDGTDSTDSFKDSIDTTNTNIAKPQSKSSNQQYVVPFGILIVLFTLYLTTSALKRTLDFNETQTDDKIEQIRELQGIQEELMTPTRWQEDMRRKFIIEKLLEHTDKCYDLAIFTKEKLDCTEAEKVNMELAMAQIGSMEQETGQVTEKDIFKNDKESTLVMDATQQLSRRDSNNARNARKKETTNKKDTTKKGATTAEPIIYLFALVFIYLLLKAASDINQHYKAQSKGDKRLRRCSLQSYAQTHKPDRRASKGIATKNFPKF